VSDPYNSYGSAVAPLSTPASMGTTTTIANAMPPPLPRRAMPDPIERLDVSEGWKRVFRLIERAGGGDLKGMRDLSFGERWDIQTNWLAFFFGPFYFLCKGLWRQTISYVLMTMLLVAVLEAMGWAPRSMGVGLGVVYSMRANVGYYMRIVNGRAPWF